MTEQRPIVSEVAAAAWVAGGLIATLTLMALTGDEHSITRGLRQHKGPFAVLAAAFLLHIYGPPATDPFALAFRPLRPTLLRLARHRAR